MKLVLRRLLLLFEGGSGGAGGADGGLIPDSFNEVVAVPELDQL